MDATHIPCPHCDDSGIDDAHSLLNEATEWLQYARSNIDLLAELVHESETLDSARIAIGLDAIGSLARLASQRIAEAHASLTWEKAQATLRDRKRIEEF